MDKFIWLKITEINSQLSNGWCRLDFKKDISIEILPVLREMSSQIFSAVVYNFIKLTKTPAYTIFCVYFVLLKILETFTSCTPFQRGAEG